MIDRIEQMAWETFYSEQGRRFAPRSVPDRKIRAWAKSMSLIADQLYESGGDDAFVMVDE